MLKKVVLTVILTEEKGICLAQIKSLAASAVMSTRDRALRALKEDLPGYCRLLRYLGRQKIVPLAVKRVTPARLKLAKRVITDGFEFRVLKNEKK